MDSALRKAYYDPGSPACFSGLRPVYIEAKKLYPKLTVDDVRLWLSSQDAYTLHKPVIRRFKHRRTITSGIAEQFQIDLADMSQLARYNNHIKYLLTCIDIFSKRAWAVPVKRKDSQSVAEAFKGIIAEQKPKRVQSDEGREFLGRPFQQLLRNEGIRFFTSTNPDIKCSIVERFNRTLKSRLARYLTSANTNRYLDVLPSILKAYNNSYHKSIKCRPVDVTAANESQVWRTLYGGDSDIRYKHFKYQVGDRVRLAKKKGTFAKGYVPQWTDEVFIISQRRMKDCAIYTVKDLQDELIHGFFYEQELQKIV